MKQLTRFISLAASIWAITSQAASPSFQQVTQVVNSVATTLVSRNNGVATNLSLFGNVNLQGGQTLSSGVGGMGISDVADGDWITKTAADGNGPMFPLGLYALTLSGNGASITNIPFSALPSVPLTNNDTRSVTIGSISHSKVAIGSQVITNFLGSSLGLFITDPFDGNWLKKNNSDGQPPDFPIGLTALSLSGNGSGITNLNPANLNGTVAIANGGTAANTAAGARTNLGLVIGVDVAAPSTLASNHWPVAGANVTITTNVVAGGATYTLAAPAAVFDNVTTNLVAWMDTVHSNRLTFTNRDVGGRIDGIMWFPSNNISFITWAGGASGNGAEILWNPLHDVNGGELQIAANNRIFIGGGYGGGHKGLMQLGSTRPNNTSGYHDAIMFQADAGTNEFQSGLGFGRSVWFPANYLSNGIEHATYPGIMSWGYLTNLNGQGELRFYAQVPYFGADTTWGLTTNGVEMFRANSSNVTFQVKTIAPLVVSTGNATVVSNLSSGSLSATNTSAANSFNGTNLLNEAEVVNGLTLGGVRNIAWPTTLASNQWPIASTGIAISTNTVGGGQTFTLSALGSNQWPVAGANITITTNTVAGGQTFTIAGSAGGGGGTWTNDQDGGRYDLTNVAHIRGTNGTGFTGFISMGNSVLYDNLSTVSVGWQTRTLSDVNGIEAVDFANRQLVDSGSNETLNWESKTLSGGWTANFSTQTVSQTFMTNVTFTTPLTNYNGFEGGNFIARTGTVSAATFAGNGGSISNITGANVAWSTNAWTGPTNALALNNTYQRYALVSGTGLSITNHTIGSAAQLNWAVLFLRNDTGSNLTLTVTAPLTGSGDGARSWTITNATTTVVSANAYGSVATNWIVRTLW